MRFICQALGMPGNGIRKIKLAQTEAALKDAARRVFAKRGYLNAKITDIAAEARRSAGSFYNHFESKEELLSVLVTDMFAEARDRVKTDKSGHDLSDRAQLRAHIAAIWDTYRAHLPEFTALLQASMVSKDFARRWRKIRAAKVEILRDHLERVRVAGFRLPGDPAIVASALNSMLEQFCYVWFVAGGRSATSRPPGDDEVIDTLTGLVLHGLTGAGRAGRKTR